MDGYLLTCLIKNDHNKLVSRDIADMLVDDRTQPRHANRRVVVAR
jgi:hypothetical protein